MHYYRDQNAKQEEVELTSPTNAPNTYYMWNNSHRKLTGNWQISFTTKAARKISM